MEIGRGTELIVETGAARSSGYTATDEDLKTGETTIMTKLSKVQSKALLTIAQNELNELSGKRLSTYYGNKATYQVLNRAGLIQVTKTSVRDGSYEAMLLTDTGRKVAIDLLHEGAAEEMETVLADREERKATARRERDMRYILEKDYKLSSDEFCVYLYLSPRHDKPEWEIKFDTMSIDHSNGGGYAEVDAGYYVNSRSMWLQGDSLDNYLRVLGTCKAIIESGILS